MSELASLQRIAGLCRAHNAPAEDLALLARLQARARRLVFRRLHRIDYEVGYADAPLLFNPDLHQLEFIERLYVLTAHRGRWQPVRMGVDGDGRRGEKARLQLMAVIHQIGEVAPVLADELGRLESRESAAGDLPLMRIPLRVDSPHIDTSGSGLGELGNSGVRVHLWKYKEQ